MTRLGILLLAGALIGGCSGSGPLLTQWEYTGGPYAQNISTILLAGPPAESIYAGLNTGELYHSPNGGATWRRVGTIRDGAVVFELLVDPDSARTLYAATSRGAYLSTTAGAEWNEISFAGSSTGIGCRAMAIDPWSPQNMYLGSIGRGMFRSTDHGGSWTQVVTAEDPSLSLGEVSSIAINLQRPDEIYAAFATAGLMKSTDRGMSWTGLTPEYTTSAAPITRILLSPEADGTILYGTASGNIFKSVDGGLSWSPTRQGLEADRVLSMAVDPDQPAVVYAGTGSGILRSTDFGTSWQLLGGSLPALPAAVTLGSSTSGITVYAYGPGIGLQKSTDSGAGWAPIDQNLGGATVTLLEADRSGTALYAACGAVVLGFDRERSLWRPASGGLRGGTIHTLTVDSDSALVVYASTELGVFKTIDGGRSWHQTLRKLSMAPDLLVPHPWIPTRLIASGEQGIWVSTDKGNSWAQAQPVKDPFRVSALGFSPSNAGVIYGCTEDGVISTSDGGFRWGAARFGMESKPMAAVAIEAENPRTVYAWSRDGSGFRSTNGGLEWGTYPSPWPSGALVIFAVDRFRPSSIVAVVDGSQVYVSETGGGSWLKVLERGFPLEVLTLHWSSSTGVLMVGTRERGVFQLPLRHLIAQVRALE